MSDIGYKKPPKKHQFKKGKSGNPNGRPPKKLSIACILREIGDEPITDKDKRTKLEIVLRRVYQCALKGESWAVSFIADRTEGKAVETIKNVQDEPITIVFESE